VCLCSAGGVVAARGVAPLKEKGGRHTEVRALGRADLSRVCRTEVAKFRQ